MKYCSSCGAELSMRIPTADDRPRHVCDHCQTVHYQNPKLVAGCLPEWGQQILLCRRSIEPRAGFWTLPAGYMENGETSWQAAVRETLEEANARVELGRLYTVLNLPHVNQVYLMFRARLLDLEFCPGAESADVRLFEPATIPWKELAFATVRQTLKFLLEDRRRGDYPMHFGDIIKSGDEYQFRNMPDPGAGG